MRVILVSIEYCFRAICAVDLLNTTPAHRNTLGINVNVASRTHTPRGGRIANPIPHQRLYAEYRRRREHKAIQVELVVADFLKVFFNEFIHFLASFCLAPAVAL